MRLSLLLVFTILMSCQSGKPCPEELNKNDLFVIQKCIDKILGTKNVESVNSYLVSPYLDRVSFTSYSKGQIETAFKTF